MPNAAELFTEVAYQIAPSSFVAKTLSSTGNPESFRIYEKLFEEGENGDYRVFTAFGDDRSIDQLKISLKDLNVRDDVLFAIAKAETPSLMEPLLNPLIELCKEEIEISNRFMMVQAIAKIGGIKAVKPMLELLNKDQSGRDIAFFVLLETGALDARTLLFEFCNIDISGFAIPYLSDFLVKNQDSESVNLLMEIAKNEDADFRRRMVATNALFEMNNQKVLKPTLELLKNDNPDIRRKALIALRCIKNPDSKLIQQLIEFLKDDNPSIRSSAVFTLGKIGNSIVVEHVIKLLKDNDENVRESAACALGLLGDPQTIEPLLELLKKSDLSAQWAPASALARISTTAYDAVKGTLIRSYCNKNEISRETVKEVVNRMHIIRNSEAWLQYHLSNEKKSFSYASFLTRDDWDKVSECCKSTLTVGSEAIAVINENHEKESVHALSCPEVKAAYWS